MNNITKLNLPTAPLNTLLGFERQRAQMAIKQQELRFGRVGLNHRQGFDQADLLNGRDQLLVLAAANDAVLHFLTG